VERIRKILSILCVSLLVWSVMSCGQDDGIEGISLSMTFSTRDLPAETTSVFYYVLKYQLGDGSTAACEDFMGSDAPKGVLSYTGDFERNGQEEVSPDGNVTLTISELPEGILMFYLEAVDLNGSTIACGCGQDEIIKGKKTIVPIRMVEDCR